MSAYPRAKPFTGLAFWFPPVVGLAPDPAAFSLRAPGSLSLAPLHFVPPGVVRLPVRVRTAHQKPAGSGARGCSQALPPHGDQALGTLGADNGGERVQPFPPFRGGIAYLLPAPGGNAAHPSGPGAGGHPVRCKADRVFMTCLAASYRPRLPPAYPTSTHPVRHFARTSSLQPLPALAGGTQGPLAGLWGIQLLSERKTPQRRFFARLRRGPVDPEFGGDFPPPSCLLGGRGNGAVPASRALFQRVFYDFQRRVYTDKTLSGARPYRFVPTL